MKAVPSGPQYLAVSGAWQTVSRLCLPHSTIATNDDGVCTAQASQYVQTGGGRAQPPKSTALINIAVAAENKKIAQRPLSFVLRYQCLPLLASCVESANHRCLLLLE
jgi:hypothetical protein